MNQPEEDWDKQLQENYRRYLENAAADPEVLRHRERLVRKYAENGAWMPFAGVSAAVALSVFLLFAFYPASQRKTVQNAAPLKVPAATEEVQVKPHRLLEPYEPVRVKRLSSKVGSTMVYQKDGNVPLTVVWVFVRS